MLAHTEKPLTGRTVASLTQPHASLRTVQVTLDDLVHNGVVLREHAGRAHLYTLNRNHLAAPAVLALANLRHELLARMRTEASTWVVRLTPPGCSDPPHAVTPAEGSPMSALTQASTLDRLLRLKPKSQYQASSISASDATKAISWAARLVEQPKV